MRIKNISRAKLPAIALVVAMSLFVAVSITYLIIVPKSEPGVFADSASRIPQLGNEPIIGQPKIGRNLKDGETNSSSAIHFDDEIKVLIGLNSNSVFEDVAQITGLKYGELPTVDETVAKKIDNIKNTLNNKEDQIFSKIQEIDPDAQIISKYYSSIAGFSVKAKASAIAEVQKLEEVKSVSQLSLYNFATDNINEFQDIPSNYQTAFSDSYSNAQQAWNTGITGRNVNFALLDSGLDYTHADFGGPGTVEAARLAADAKDMNASQFAQFLNDNPGIMDQKKILGSWDFANNDANVMPNPDLQFDHGTHVASIAAGYGENADGTTFKGDYSKITKSDLEKYGDNAVFKIGPGVAPKAGIYALKLGVDDGGGLVGDETIVEAVDWIVSKNLEVNIRANHRQIDVANLSLGAAMGPTDGILNVALARLAASGVLPVVAEGNSGDTIDVDGSPANSVAALTVASIKSGHIRVPNYSIQITDANGKPIEDFGSKLTMEYSGFYENAQDHLPAEEQKLDFSAEIVTYSLEEVQQPSLEYPGGQIDPDGTLEGVSSFAEFGCISNTAVSDEIRLTQKQADKAKGKIILLPDDADGCKMSVGGKGNQFDTFQNAGAVALVFYHADPKTEKPLCSIQPHADRGCQSLQNSSSTFPGGIITNALATKIIEKINQENAKDKNSQNLEDRPQPIIFSMHFLKFDEEISEAEASDISEFSSRGEHGSFNYVIKPDLSAPGQDIYAAKFNSGTDGTLASGTSMATPHATGAALILKQLKRHDQKWTVTDTKQILMNTANNDITNHKTSTNIQNYSTLRTGTGAINIPDLLKADTLVYDEASPDLVSASWGVVEVSKDDVYSNSKRIKVQNLTDHAKTYHIEYSDKVNIEGVSITIPQTEIHVNPWSAVSFEVQIKVIANDLKWERDPQKESANSQGYELGYIPEFSGILKVIDSDQNIYRITSYIAPKFVSKSSNLDHLINVDENANSAEIQITSFNHPDNNSAPLVAPFIFGGESGKLIDNEITAASQLSAQAYDIKYYGASVANGWLNFGANMYGMHNTITPQYLLGAKITVGSNRFIAFITSEKFDDVDIPYLTVSDYAKHLWLEGARPNDLQWTLLFDEATGKFIEYYPYGNVLHNINFPGSGDYINQYDTNSFVFSLPTEKLGINDNTQFEYQLFTCSTYYGTGDELWNMSEFNDGFCPVGSTLDKTNITDFNTATTPHFENGTLKTSNSPYWGIAILGGDVWKGDKSLPKSAEGTYYYDNYGTIKVRSNDIADILNTKYMILHIDNSHETQVDFVNK